MKKLVVLFVMIFAIGVFAQQKPGEAVKTEPAKAAAPAKTESGLTVKEIVICTDVDRAKFAYSGAADTFQSDVGKLWCFTEIKGATEETYVTHVWYLEEDKLAEVKLSVKYPLHKTWSSKKILKYWAGKWTVKVLDEFGKEIGSKTFTLEQAPEKPKAETTK